MCIINPFNAEYNSDMGNKCLNITKTDKIWHVCLAKENGVRPVLSTSFRHTCLTLQSICTDPKNLTWLRGRSSQNTPTHTTLPDPPHMC